MIRIRTLKSMRHYWYGRTRPRCYCIIHIRDDCSLRDRVEAIVHELYHFAGGDREIYFRPGGLYL